MMYDQEILCLMDADGKNNRLITQQLDRQVTSLRWGKDSKTIAFLVADDRARYVAAYDVASGKTATVIKGEYSVGGLEANADGNWLIEMSNPYTPTEFSVCARKREDRTVDFPSTAMA